MSGAPWQDHAAAQLTTRALQGLCAVLGVVLVVLVALLALRTLGGTGQPALGADVVGVSAPGTGPGAPTPTATVPAGSGAALVGERAAADERALATLRELRRQGLAEHPPQGQWVAQLAAKSVGTTDPVQTAANGSSTFYATDILEQTRRIASRTAGGDVFVLASTDFAPGTVDARGNPYWTTFATGPFADADDVRTWCDSVFASTPADERTNVCFPERLLPPS
ncbi:hypothetical protein [Kineococcus sp. SYSU DK018]|uniref:hypothetical protein n=1 Tax=Kineococcus sp. SYSU DK018 TaxID=3383139 RepID=UPI003D7CE2B7